MSVLLYAIVLVGGFFFVSQVLLGKWRAERQERRMRERVDAYLSGMARSGTPEPLRDMGEAERRDTLIMAARRIRTERERRFYVTVGGGIFTVFTAIAFGIEGEGVRDFLIAMAVGAMAIYGVNVFLARRLRASLAARGIEPEKLRVD